MEERRTSEAGAARAEEVLGTAPDAPEGVPRYRLQGSLWRVDAEQIQVTVRLLPAEGRRRLAAARADVAVASLPQVMAGVPSPVGPGTGRLHEARAAAVISARLDREAAKRAARNLARARVIAQAIGVPAPVVEEVTSETEAVAVLENLLNEGLPTDERWFPVAPDAAGSPAEERVAVGLAAQVVPVGGVFRPDVTAILGRKIYRAGDPITIEIRSEESAYLGVFGWGADNRVVRLYPANEQVLHVGAGDVQVLPRPGDGSIVSEPLRVPDNQEDHEAFIVVAAAELVDFAALAPPAGATLPETQNRAVPGGQFLAALGALDLGRTRVILLPYQVHR